MTGSEIVQGEEKEDPPSTEDDLLLRFDLNLMFGYLHYMVKWLYYEDPPWTEDDLLVRFDLNLIFGYLHFKVK